MQYKPIIRILILFCLPVAMIAQCNLGNIQPEKPKLGDTITVSYCPDAPDARLRGTSSIIAEVLFLHSATEGDDVLHEFPLKREGASWKASFVLSDSRCVIMLLRFSSGDTLDDNGGDVWLAMVHGADGQPVDFAQTYLAEFFMGNEYYGFTKQTDIEAAMAAANKEIKAHPRNVFAPGLLFFMMTRNVRSDSAKKGVIPKLDELYIQFINEEHAEESFIQLYWLLGAEEKAHELLIKMIIKNTEAKLSRRSRWKLVKWERLDLQEQDRFSHDITEYIKEFPDDLDAQELLWRLNSRKGFALLDSLPDPDGIFYTKAAESRIITMHLSVDSMIALAKKGVDHIRLRDINRKPFHQSSREWRNKKKEDLGNALGVYAYNLSRNGRGKEALTAFDEAYGMTVSHDTLFSERYLACLVAEADYDKALNLGLSCVARCEVSGKILKLCETAYQKLNGTVAGFGGFDAKLNEARKNLKRNLRDDLKRSMLHKTAADFIVKSLEGQTISLSSLKGKVVVLEFWATWCGPCAKSLPVLQKVYEKFRNNPDVAFLALDTWERVSQEQRLVQVRDDMEKYRYTFPVYLDDGTAERYGVQGVPTSFVIDRAGRIRFRSSGFEGAFRMEENLTAQIELLLENEK